jgi:hypothetical protein
MKIEVLDVDACQFSELKSVILSESTVLIGCNGLSYELRFDSAEEAKKYAVPLLDLRPGDSYVKPYMIIIRG